MSKVLVFKLKMKQEDGRPYLMALPSDGIRQVTSVWGSQNVYCKVNGVEVDCSFEDLINHLNGRLKGTNLEFV